MASNLVPARENTVLEDQKQAFLFLYGSISSISSVKNNYAPVRGHEIHPPFAVAAIGNLVTKHPVEKMVRAPKDYDPDLDWFNRSKNPSNPDLAGFDQSQTWQPKEIHLEDGRILVLDYT
jgi:hypothetical protein